MGFFSGLTLGGMTGAVGRMASGGGGLFGPGAPEPRPGGGDMLDRLRSAMDPERLAIAQALLAGDYGAVSRMTAPLRQRRLARREELKRSRSHREALSPDMSNGAEPHPATYPSYPMAGAGGEAGRMPLVKPSHTASVMKSASSKSAGQGDPVTRQMATHPEPDDGGIGGAIAQNAVRAVESERIRQARIMKGINGFGYMPTREDHNLLARALFAEGRNTPEDMEALAYAIINRIRPLNSPREGPELGHTLEEVLSAPPQFSFWPNSSQPEGSASWILSAHPERMNQADRGSWNTAVKVAERAFGNAYKDPTGHASFFFASPEYDGRWQTAPEGFYRDALRRGSLERSPYRSPYRLGDPDRWPNHFFEDPDDQYEKR